MKNDSNNNDTTSTESNLPSSAKGSSSDVQVANVGVEAMLQQFHQVLDQIKQSMDSENAENSEGTQQLAGLANQLAENLQKQDNNAGEASMQVVLQIIDAVADMLDNGQISISAKNTEAK